MTDWPTGKYGAILADPPWPFVTWSHVGLAGGPGDYQRPQRSRRAPYATQDHSTLEEMPVADLAAPDCVLFLWIVQTQIPQAVKLCEAWGFKLKSIAFYWIKGNETPLFPGDIVSPIGTGYWTRAQGEQCWLATKGKPKRQAADVRQLIVAPRREHSRKPDEVHSRIERLVAGPYLELFARTPRKGWTVWGNETDKFEEAS